MSKIATDIATAFEKLSKTGSIRNFAKDIGHTFDYSVRSGRQAAITYEAIDNACNSLIEKLECVWYNGETGMYELLEIDPNELTLTEVKTKAWEWLQQTFCFEDDDERKVVESLYLLPVWSLIRLGDIE